MTQYFLRSSAAALVLLLASAGASTAAPGPTPTPQAKPTAASAPTAAPTAQPTAPSTSPPKPTPPPAPSPTPSPAPTKAPEKPVATPTAVAVRGSSIHGVVFLDANADGTREKTEDRAPQLVVRLTAADGRVLRSETDDNGAYRFEGVKAGTYRLSLKTPVDFATTTAEEQVVEVDGVHEVAFDFGLISASDPRAPQNVAAAAEAPAHEASAEAEAPTTDQDSAAQSEDPASMAEPTAESEPAPVDALGDSTPAAEDTTEEAAEDATEESVEEVAEDAGEGEQVMALRQVTSLDVRFAPGRDTLDQVVRRTLADGSLWLGVPFRTQIDGTEFQFVNCGPASLTMVLAAFGLDVEAGRVRDYLNYLTDNYDRDVGTSLDVLSGIAKQAGLTPLDLYSDNRGYRDWSVDAVRWHVSQGRPVITLVKYKDLPGHSRSPSETDHYIVITGLTPDGFIYNDAAFATTLGYGLAISQDELERAWDNSSIPHHAVAMALADGHQGELSFPERPRPVATPAPPQERELSDGGTRGPLADLTETPEPRAYVAPTPPAAAIGAQTVADDSLLDVDPILPDAAQPSGFAVEGDQEPLLVSPSGPRRMAGMLFVLLGGLWAALIGWSLAGALLRRVTRIPVRALVSALLQAIR